MLWTMMWWWPVLKKHRAILSSVSCVHLPIEDVLKEEEMFFLNNFKICSPFPPFCLYLSKKWLTTSRRDMFPLTSRDLLGFSWGQCWQMLAGYWYPLLAQGTSSCLVVPSPFEGEDKLKRWDNERWVRSSIHH